MASLASVASVTFVVVRGARVMIHPFGVRQSMTTRTPEVRYFEVPCVTEPCSWRWKIEYTISTGTTVITTAANRRP